MPIEIKEIRVRTTIVENNQKQAASPELIRKLKSEIMADVKNYLGQNEKRKRER